MNEEQRKRIARLVALSAAGCLCPKYPALSTSETPRPSYVNLAAYGAYAWPRKGGAL